MYVGNYTSPTLSKDLFSCKIHTTGTLVMKWKGKLKVIHTYNELSKPNIPRGTGRYVRDESIFYAVWGDTKCIAVISSKHGGHFESTVSRNSQHSNWHHVKVDVSVP